ncbi:protein-histidine kinase [Gigaspora margarita]|uniref:Protein-histidine kinase n=1 Tax=Gigaspora margarita TaxID=4874 RepID=A0A8H4AKV5_GIGMA|nr:protein-histidine kinase [Gigaspora margarita]
MIPVILLSAKAGEESKIEGLNKGADDYLIKPFSARELITRIQANIKLSHLRRKISFQQYKQEETKQLLLTISNKILSGLDLNETLLDIIKEIHHKLPSERILIISNDQSEFKNNKIVALYDGSESIPSTNNLLNEINDKNKSSKILTNLQEFLNNYSGIDVCLDLYCDDVCKNVSVLSVEIRLSNTCWGWIKLYRSPNSIWLDSEIELLQQISNQISLVINYVKILEENTENDIKIKAAEIANKTKSQILANTSHELRTPLGAIVGILSSFENTSTTTDQRDMINIMARASDIVLSIVNDILDAAKLEARKITLINRTFDLLELFEGTIEKFGKEAGAKKIELIVNCEVDSFPRYVKSDPDRLKQVLSHLLSNSVKFTNNGKIVLTISMQLQEVIDKDKERQTYGQIIQRGKLLVELCDTGIGMDPEYIKHAWQSFSQGDMSITKMQDGTGLGLSICKNLVEINGGEIKVESELGKGSKFWFTWHVELLSSISSSLLSTQFDRMSYSLPQSIKQKRILIIHSVEDARNAMLNYLKKIDKVDAFDTFDKGIRAAKQYKELNNQFSYDIVFISLYKTNEDEIMKSILELRRLDNNLIIIFIVFPTNEENELAEKLIGKVGGATAILYTPITWKKIVNLFMYMEKNYVTIESVLKQEDYKFFKTEDTNQDIYEDIKKSDPKKKKCILCVDDNYISLENTLRQVSKLGYSTISATNGLEAVKLIDSNFILLNDTYSSSFYSDINSHGISLILTECNLPMMSGFDVSQVVRTMKSPISDTPIVVLTALPMEEIRNKCIELKINDYLAKPLKIEELEKVLTKWISEN